MWLWARHSRSHCPHLQKEDGPRDDLKPRPALSIWDSSPKGALTCPGAPSPPSGSSTPSLPRLGNTGTRRAPARPPGSTQPTHRLLVSHFPWRATGLLGHWQTTKRKLNLKTSVRRKGERSPGRGGLERPGTLRLRHVVREGRADATGNRPNSAS